MRFLIAAISFSLCQALCAHPALAGQAEVREVALNNNCTPKKIEVFQQQMGDSGQTTYRVTCVVPKAVGLTEGSVPADSILVACTYNLCQYLQAFATSSK